ncbi:DUF1294 domain-containing protein [Neptunomonas japonica]|uniref:DUF1294 domain-containing protein n=1 Tax=Neptunomonas japonica TaxID=417574 RepID=UPI0003F66776|nr:DUF1294 domain-containing protein [Neptunomonas japonica]
MMKILSFATFIAFAILATASVAFYTLPFLVLAIYLAMSIITFITYALDKSAAINGRWRTKESTLHVFALAGGWPGALLAQQTLRHKSSKQAFINVLWITVIVNLGGFIWLHSADGSSFLNSYLHTTNIKFIHLVTDISLPDFVQIWLWKINYYFK